MYNKHYIRLYGTTIIKGFSDSFESPLETDICINNKGDRHFELFGKLNPQLQDETGYFYKYIDGKVVQEITPIAPTLHKEEPLNGDQVIDILKFNGYDVWPL